MQSTSTRPSPETPRAVGAAPPEPREAGALPANWVLSVVIPVYNERRTIREIIDRVRSMPIPKEIIVVDDCSRDGTREILRSIEGPDLRILYHDRNQGKGAALRTGFGHATGDVIVVQDADLEYDPHDYHRLLEPIVEGRADAVYGSRFHGAASSQRGFWHRTGNSALTKLSNIFTGLRLSDMETCYKAFTRRALAGIALKQQRFGFEPEITAKLARRGCRVCEVPISYAGRNYTQGKKIGLGDLVNAVYCIVRYAVTD